MSRPRAADGIPAPAGGRRAVITGGAGFLGSHMVDRLLASGWSVVCLDNLVTGRLDNIAHLQDHPRFSFREVDVTDRVEVPGDVDAVLHFASPASPPDYISRPVETLDVGTVGTRHALELAHSKNARFLITSTSEVYGDPLVHPQTESYWGNVNPVGPRSVYDEAKRAAEAYVMSFHRSYGVDTRIVRIFNTYGPRMRRDDGRAVPQFIEQSLAGLPLTVYGDGSQTRSLCYVDDLMEGLERLLLSDIHDPINLGNDEEVTILQLAELIRRLTHSHSPVELHPLPADDPKRRCPDVSMAREQLGWAPRVELADGLGRTIAWWRGMVDEASEVSIHGGVSRVAT